MKRFGLALGAVCLLAVGIPGIAAGAADRDWVVGAIKRTSLDGKVNQHHVISAHQMPKGGAQGQYQATYVDAAGKRTGYRGRVTCVNAVGNRAWVGIEILPGETRPDLSAGQGSYIRVVDNGGPSDGADDVISPGPAFNGPANNCPTPSGDVTPTYSGNLLVHDGG